jgi:hypothetical protein
MARKDMTRKDMTRKDMTRKTHRAKRSALQTIPELRRSFDYIDEFVKNRIVSGVPKETLVKEVQREWLRVFSKRLQKKNATAFVEHMMERQSHRRGLRGTRKRSRLHGGVAPFADPTTQQGVYLASGTPPTSAGHYPLANGAASAYGSLTSYLSKGFFGYEIASDLDPIKGQTSFPTQPPPSMGSNLVRGGARALQYKTKRGGASLVGSVLTQAMTRPIQSSAVPSPLQDAQNAWMGRPVGPSPDQVQRGPTYLLGSSAPAPVNLKLDI